MGGGGFAIRTARGPLVVVLGLAAMVQPVAPGPPSAAAGTELVIVQPRPEATSPPDLEVVVRLTGSGPASARFGVTVDGTPARFQVEPSGTEAGVATVRRGANTTMVVGGLPEGPHVLRLVPASPGVAAPAAVSFTVQASGRSLPFILIGVALVGLIIVYRQRILGPWADRYERRDGPEPDEE